MPLIWLPLSMLSAQSSPLKYDNIWLFGFGGGNPAFPMYGDCMIDFSDGIPKTSNMARKMDMDGTNGSVCDKNGGLLFYTNGLWIASSLHDTIEGGGE